jgi:hypothetical protein
MCQKSSITDSICTKIEGQRPSVVHEILLRRIEALAREREELVRNQMGISSVELRTIIAYENEQREIEEISFGGSE